METANFFGTEKISKILLQTAPPIMLAQLIQALYNIVDSFFIGQYSETGLTALSIVFPFQLLMSSLAIGCGVGINTAMAASLGTGQTEDVKEYAGIGTPLAISLWLLFALIGWFSMPAYTSIFTSSEVVSYEVILYGRIICVGSTGLALESIWTKILQAQGDMKTPMYAQILGAVTNLILDPFLIFGLFGVPKMGMAGAALATITGQFIAAFVVGRKAFFPSPSLKKYPSRLVKIAHLGAPNMLMQSAYTFYIFGLNLILASFSDQAVTALGLYYKWQSFFCIPLRAMQTCIIPIISFNYAARNIERCKQALTTATGFGFLLMGLGGLCFELIPVPMLKVFTSDPLVIAIGQIGFRFVGISFIPMVTSLIFPVFFQAVGSSLKSSCLTVLRVMLFVPLGYFFSRFGLTYFWTTFILTEVFTSIAGLFWYRSFLKKNLTS